MPTGTWTKSRLLFLGIGVVLCGLGIWQIAGSLAA